MRRLVALILLISMSFQLMGFQMVHWSSIYWQKKEMKRAIKRGLSNKDMHFFKFGEEEYQQLRWEKKGKEFWYQDCMYDIVRVEKMRDGQINISCISDEQEAKLFASLDQEVKQFSDVEQTGRNGHKQILKKLKSSAAVQVRSVQKIMVAQAVSYPILWVPAENFSLVCEPPPPEVQVIL